MAAEAKTTTATVAKDKADKAEKAGNTDDDKAKPKPHCICGDPTYTIQRGCVNTGCGETWSVLLKQHQRMSYCKLHHEGVAICSWPVELCSKCGNQGFTKEKPNHSNYTIVRTVQGFGGQSGYSIYKVNLG